MITAKVKRVRHKDLGKILAQLRGPKKVKVGFPAGEADQENINKALWNEFGTKGGASGGGWGGPIPERPFMRNAISDNAAGYRAAMKAEAPLILRGDIPLRKSLAKLGEKAKGDIKSEIISLSTPPNSPVTIAMKGSANPLVDTGAMGGAVTWKIDDD
jgi:hypothetical protein